MNSQRLNPFRAGRCLSTVSLGSTIGDGTSLNPFRAGRCLSTKLNLSLSNRPFCVSIPFEQGDVFRRCNHLVEKTVICLNPFRAGRCLSTITKTARRNLCVVSIPFEQGDVFRPKTFSTLMKKKIVSIPFEQGDVFRLMAKIPLLIYH